MNTPAPHPQREVERAVVTVAAQSLEWLWPGWLARGVLTLLDGDPDLGKSTLAVTLAAHVSRGTSVAVTTVQTEGKSAKRQAAERPAHGVLLLSAEDDPARVIRPRLEAAGADLARVFLLDHAPGHPERPVQLPEDLAALREVVERQGVGLVVVDPLMAYLGRGVNAGSDPHVRRVLHRLKMLAEETQCALLVIRHLNKTGHMAALYRGGGSIGIIGACRAAMLLGRDPADEQKRVLVMNKFNLGPKPVGLRFRLERLGAAAVVVWEGECPYTADEVVGKMTEKEAEQINRVDECAAHVRDLLRLGPMLSNDLDIFCRAAGFGEITVRRARKKLGVKAKQTSFGAWEVSLPTVGGEKGRRSGNGL